MIGGAALAPGSLRIEPAVGRDAEPIIDICCGPLQVRLAESRADIDAVQALRYRIFYESLGARAAYETARRRRDFDRFDEQVARKFFVGATRATMKLIVVASERAAHAFNEQP